MARPIRYTQRDSVYHVISRFVAGEFFIRTNGERNAYLRLLENALEKSDWKCLAYAVMSNHVHLAMLAGATPLSSWIRRVNAPFAEYINEKHARIGAVFVRGPNAHEVGPDAVANLIAYIHNNPVRAGVVHQASDTDWTSHRAYLDPTTAPLWLAVACAWMRLPFTARATFDAWVNTHPDHRAEPDLTKLRRAARVRGALALGTPTLEDAEGRASAPLLVRPSAHLRVDPREVVELTAYELGIPVEELCSRRRSKLVVGGRYVAVRASDSLGIVGADIAAALAISGQAVTAIRRRKQPPAILDVAERVTRMFRT